MTTDELRQQAELWERWHQDSQEIVGRVIPGLFKTCETLQTRTEVAEASASNLFRRVTELEVEVGRLQRDRVELTVSLERRLGEMARWCADMLVELRAGTATRETPLLDHAEEGAQTHGT